MHAENGGEKDEGDFQEALSPPRSLFYFSGEISTVEENVEKFAIDERNAEQEVQFRRAAED